MTSVENYLHDVIHELKESALSAKRLRDESFGTESYDYQIGYSMAYYEVISLVIDQAKAFDLSIADLGLNDLQPERDLM